jgi:hypothetical protein
MNPAPWRMVLLFALVQVWPAGVHAETAPSTAEQQFEQALKEFNAENFELALEHFRAAFALERSVKIWKSIISCLIRMDRDVEAIAEYDALVAEQGDQIPPNIQADLEKYLLYRGKILGFGLLYVETSHAGRIFVDGKPLKDSASRIPRRLLAGNHTVRLEAPGMAPAEQTVEVRSGERRRMRIKARRPYQIDARLGLSGGGSTAYGKLNEPCSVYCFPGFGLLAGARLSVPIKGSFVAELGADYFHARTSITDDWDTGRDITSRFSLHTALAHVGVGMDITRSIFRFQWRIGGGFIAGQHWETPLVREIVYEPDPIIFHAVVGSRIGLSVRHRRTWFGIGVEGWSTLISSSSSYDVPRVPTSGQANAPLYGPPDAEKRNLGRVVFLSPEMSVGWEF